MSPGNQEELNKVEHRMRRVLENYELASQRGDYLEAVLAVHTALEDALKLYLDEEQAKEFSFFDKVGAILPNQLESLGQLNTERSYYAHPRQRVMDSEFQGTAMRLVDQVLEAWPKIFSGSPPAIIHPAMVGSSGSGAERVGASQQDLYLSQAIRQIDQLEADVRHRDQRIQQLEKLLDQAPGQVEDRSFPWRQLLLGLIFLLPIPLWVGFGRALWGERPPGWIGVLVAALFFLLFGFFALRSLWRFLRAFKLSAIVTLFCTLLILATLIMLPLAGRGLRWNHRVGAALAGLLGAAGQGAGGYVEAVYGTGVWLAERLLPDGASSDREGVPGEDGVSPSPESPAGRATPIPASRPSRTPESTPVLDPEASIGIGSLVQVMTQGAQLRARVEPGLEAELQTRFEDGDLLEVVDGPAEVDGFVWWLVEGESGSGWSAATFLVPVLETAPTP